MLRSSHIVKRILLTSFSLLFVVILFWVVRGSVWTIVDYQVLDKYYLAAIKSGYGPSNSDKIIYIVINDESYRDYFKKNVLDRYLLAKIIDTLDVFRPAGIAADLIFAYPSDSLSDATLLKTISRTRNIYLPVAFALDESDQKDEFTFIPREKENLIVYNPPIELNRGKYLKGKRAITQYGKFFKATDKSGHINVLNDEDGVLRHSLMLIRVDSSYYPSLALSMFLDYIESSMKEVIIEWGEQIIILASENNWLNENVVIPINDRGETFIPFLNKWSKDFPFRSVSTLMKDLGNPLLRGNVSELFEGKFVFIGDVATGTSDISHTPVEENSPLISTHSSVLNGLLTNQFYKNWNAVESLLLLIILTCILTASSIQKKIWVFYLCGVLCILFVLVYAWFQITNYSLLPVFSLSGSFIIVFIALTIDNYILESKERAFIKNAFSHYVTPGVVEKILEQPQTLQLGGEERHISVLFSDIENFTVLSEKLVPADLVKLLRIYLSEMTNVILEEDGTIDKFIGDCVMALFGAPVYFHDHAKQAVTAAIKMRSRLPDLNQRLTKLKLPEINFRVGINTGAMVVGNIGSENVFDYTVIGDAVNLASRLEQANKKYGTHLLISEYTFNELKNHSFYIRPLDVVKVKGKDNAVKIFDVYGNPDTQVKQKDYYSLYSEAFDLYLNRKFELAESKLYEAEKLLPNDKAAKILLNRIKRIDLSKLPDAWDGYYE